MTTTTPEPDRQLLALAIGIAEWAGALEHIEAVLHLGAHATWNNIKMAGDISNELDTLIHHWPRLTSPVLSRDDVIAEARMYCTKHQHDVDALLSETEGD